MAIVPSLEVGDMLLTSATTGDHSARDESLPEFIQPTVHVEPVSLMCMYGHRFLDPQQVIEISSLYYCVCVCSVV